MAKQFTKLGKYLRDQRVERGLSQSQVAKKLGYSTAQFISNWERGISSPPVKTLKRLSQIYSVSPQQIFNVFEEEYIRQLRTQFWGNVRRAKA